MLCSCGEDVGGSDGDSVVGATVVEVGCVAVVVVDTEETSAFAATAFGLVPIVGEETVIADAVAVVVVGGVAAMLGETSVKRKYSTTSTRPMAPLLHLFFAFCAVLPPVWLCERP